MSAHPETLKLSGLRPCDGCGGKVAPMFYRVQVRPVVLRPSAINATLGLSQMFGGALDVAEVFAPGDAAEVGGPELQSTLFLCVDCYVNALGQASERRREAQEREQRAKCRHSWGAIVDGTQACDACGATRPNEPVYERPEGA